jgi:1-pyrroline-5-carboxylate dehydrogenase
VYAPKSTWPALKEALVEHTKSIRVGQPDDLSAFVSAVIDGKALARHRKYLDEAKAGTSTTVLVGGNVDDSTGYFVEPTVIETTDPKSPTMTDELFGPIVTVYVYDDSKPNAWEDVLDLVNDTSKYGLTGAVFALDRAAVVTAETKLRHACGNFYINDKCTGAVVGEQPFGGARASGTNDKAGSMLNLLRWTSAQAVKETTTELTDYRYPYMK